ncbi:MAG: NAD(P)-dependent alcohol dehydrogenase [Myxococcales bacterium]|nr:NAD(P)-dependent alcohol dehydrogenase [Myxococcales bacterium]
MTATTTATTHPAQSPLTATPTMQAVVASEYGPASQLRVATVARPAIGEDEVLVRVHAAGLDRGAWHLMTGKPYLMRLMGFGLLRPRNGVLGREVAGTVVEVGARVTRFAAGDAVFGIGEGSFAEYVRARADKLANTPAGVSSERAATIGISGLTALQALRDAGRLVAGQRVLIIGASGGVGSFAVQIARSMGAEVTGACSTAKLELVRSLGAQHVLDYTREDIVGGPQRYDLILDTGGNTPAARLRRALTPNGVAVLVGGENGGSVTGGFFGRPLWGMALTLFSRQRFAIFMARETHVDLERLGQMLAEGTVSPSIDRVCSLAEVKGAMRDLEAGRVRGKVCVAVA